MTTQEILQLLDEKRVLTAPAAVAWDEVQRQQNRLNQAAKRLNGPITVTLALNLLFAFTIFLLEQSHLMHGFLLMLGLMGGLMLLVALQVLQQFLLLELSLLELQEQKLVFQQVLLLLEQIEELLLGLLLGFELQH